VLHEDYEVKEVDVTGIDDSISAEGKKKGQKDRFPLSPIRFFKSLPAVSPKMKAMLGLGDEKMENTSTSIYGSIVVTHTPSLSFALDS